MLAPASPLAVGRPGIVSSPRPHVEALEPLYRRLHAQETVSGTRWVGAGARHCSWNSNNNNMRQQHEHSVCPSFPLGSRYFGMFCSQPLNPVCAFWGGGDVNSPHRGLDSHHRRLAGAHLLYEVFPLDSSSAATWAQPRMNSTTEKSWLLARLHPLTRPPTIRYYGLHVLAPKTPPRVFSSPTWFLLPLPFLQLRCTHSVDSDPVPLSG